MSQPQAGAHVSTAGDFGISCHGGAALVLYAVVLALVLAAHKENGSEKVKPP